MLSKQQLIHIATDAVLISLLFLYVNNKTKAVADAMDDLREYTEDQIESINNKLDNIISHITKQKQVQQQYQQVQQYSQPQKPSPKVQVEKSQQLPQKVQYSQPKPQKANQVPSQVRQQQTHNSQSPVQQQVQPEIPKFKASAQVSKQVRFNTMPDITHIDEFVNSIPSSFAFISATTTPIMTQQPVQASNIEVIEEEENVQEEDVSNDLINELDENDIEEINNALGEDSVESDDIKNE